MKSNKLFYKNLPAFTLVELIVVIVILAILATISFLSFDSYSSKSRDSVRLSDTTNITKGLELFQIKAGNYPIPNSPTYYTGGLNGTNIITQGTINGNIIGLSNSTPSDPLTNTPYVYSISGDSKYYQIYSELENITSFNNIENTTKENINIITYADNTSSKQSLIKGNYLFDPSLPSLIIIPNSVPTTNGSGGIFSPDVCFITNKSTNNILSSSTSSNCTKKKLSSLNTTDSSLVGYWDMETISGGLLKDLSGNGNDGIFSGGMVYNSALTGGIISKGLLFDGNLNQIYITGSNGLNINGNVTVSSIVKISDITKYNQIIFERLGNYCIVHNSTTGLKNFRFADCNGNGFSALSDISVGGNYILVGTYNYTSGITSVYLNGKLVSSGRPDSGNNWTNSTTNTGITLIGARHNSAIYGFSGMIDEVKVFNRILSDGEIKQQAKIAGF